MYKTVLNEKSLDAILVTDPLSMRYLSGFSGGEGALFISKDAQILITDSRYTQAASKESDYEIIEENSSQKREEIIARLAKNTDAAKIGFEDASLTVADYNKYEAGLRGIGTLVPLCGALDNLRVIKTDEEINLMEKAQSIADAAFIAALRVVRAGMSELDGAAELEYQMKKAGAHDISFNTIFAAGRNSSMPHAVPTEYKIKTGDFITIDFGCKYNGYCSDTTRTIAVGEPSIKQKNIYEIVLKAHKKALASVRPGITGDKVDAAARYIIKEAGYGSCFGHSTGHAVGLAVHEEPRFAPNAKTVCRIGMTGTIEPGIYLPGEFGVRIEDMIVVTSNGCRSFTRLPKELMILG